LKLHVELKAKGVDVKPEVMVPTCWDCKRATDAKKIIVDTAERVMAQKKVSSMILVGTMIEVPRAALTVMRLLRKRTSSPLEQMTSLR
jgi:pyruvate,orthophosphate dikinase